MKAHILSILLFANLLVLSSCSEKIDIDLNEGQQKLIVDAWITNEPKEHLVKLNLSSNYFSNQPLPPAEGATVTINDEAGNVENLQEKLPGHYYTNPNFAGEIGKTYFLKILYKGEEYLSSAKMDSVPQIDSLQYILKDEDKPEDEKYNLELFTQELPGEGDYYMFYTYVNDELKTDTLYNVVYVSDLLVDGNYIANWRLPNVDFVKGDKVTLEAYSISEDAYDFFDAVIIESDRSGGLFETQPANITSNISNGALGLFFASAVSRDSIVVE